ncbi:probable isoquinoline 1-oxidoreductase (alpha subunit)oxidoreductase protein [Erythrobacter sp. NAP1]|uniref:(2Fe-2S)-binding protein n=1 Tax=Erythrobacter sp. NAP1 TaxID=237727 RepID=UPI0000687719|nr:(2Fe-2S)-binding protein [Erythrobacter sp. NAP1]EAQ29098.1 probable isoquinoline 1-oxidoreductase (alpha subunit)oxidoreductase protein [Erythrobacter sp. NAP1]
MPRMTVNDRPVEFDLDAEMPLLYALREALNLTGTKAGGGGNCDCGACMVLVDGAALRSCRITLAEAEGRFITTIEGVSRDRSHPVQQAMVAEQAIQCGYCTPGIVIAAAALLQRNPVPSRAEIEDAIQNMCRCGVYPRLVSAIQRAGRVAQRGESIGAAPAPGIAPEDAAAMVPALRTPSDAEAPED